MTKPWTECAVIDGEFRAAESDGPGPLDPSQPAMKEFCDMLRESETEMSRLMLGASALTDPLGALNLSNADRGNLAMSMAMLGVAEVTTDHEGRQSITRPYELAVRSEVERLEVERLEVERLEVERLEAAHRSDPVGDQWTKEESAGDRLHPELEPITCPKCGTQHPRQTVQGGVIEDGAILLCPCDTAMRVGAGPFAESVDMKTCTNFEFVQILKARDAMKAARRRVKAQRHANRTAAERRRAR